MIGNSWGNLGGIAVIFVMPTYAMVHSNKFFLCQSKESVMVW